MQGGRSGREDTEDAMTDPTERPAASPLERRKALLTAARDYAAAHRAYEFSRADERQGLWDKLEDCTEDLFRAASDWAEAPAPEGE